MSADPQQNSGPQGPTDDELLARMQRQWEERQASQPAAPADTSSIMSEVPKTRAASCSTCGAPMEVPDFTLWGRQIFPNHRHICDACRERQQREEEERAERERQERLEMKRERRRAGLLDILHAVGVNAWDHRDATLENFDTVQSGPGPVAAVRQFLADVRAAEKYDQVRGLYLFGATGTGKSHLAAAVARELVLDIDIDPNEIVFDHALRLIGKIQRTYSNEESADAVLNERINAKVWILDDLGTEAPSADVVRRLTEIFTERAMRPTLVTSNLRPDELEGRHAEFYRIVSRLGPRYFRTVKVAGSDRRFIAA